MLLTDIKLNEKNPRVIKDEKFQKLCASLKEFPKMMELRPIIVDDNNIVLGGNMRLRALQQLGYTEVDDSWVKRASDLTEEQKKEFIIKDNVGFGEWDWDMLANEWDKEQLEQWGLDLMPWDNDEAEKLSEEYSQKIGQVVYEPKQTNHKPEDLFVPEHKFDEEIETIQDDKIKEMLKARAAYFSNFDYPKIADYYAYQASPEEKAIFEKLALVLLDRDKLIENGFSKIMTSLVEEDKEDE